MAVSIADVAKRANVSISTVSRVLNRRTLVNEQTRSRVEAAIRELGYAPNFFARGLMLRRSEIVGLVLPDIHGEFYSEIIRGANLQARQCGYNLVVSSAREGDDGHSLLAAIQKRTLLDGVAVLVSEVTDHVQSVLADFSLPYVVLDGDLNGTPHDSVVIDQREGAVALMRHLTAVCRMQRVVFVGGHETNIDTRTRFDAYQTVLSEAGLSIGNTDVHFLDYQYDTAYNFALRHIRTWAGPRAAVFAANDEMAAGILSAASAMNIAVPRELAIVGFDDTRIATMTRPNLTTVRVPMSEMGARAIDLLCSRIADAERPTARITLQPELIVRESCGARLSIGDPRVASAAH